MKKREDSLNKLKYRTNLIDTFNRVPLKCRCGKYLNEFSDDTTYQMICPECDDNMFEKGKMN